MFVDHFYTLHFLIEYRFVESRSRSFSVSRFGRTWARFMCTSGLKSFSHLTVTIIERHLPIPISISANIIFSIPHGTAVSHGIRVRRHKVARVDHIELPPKF